MQITAFRHSKHTSESQKRSKSISNRTLLPELHRQGWRDGSFQNGNKKIRLTLAATYDTSGAIAGTLLGSSRLKFPR